MNALTEIAAAIDKAGAPIDKAIEFSVGKEGVPIKRAMDAQVNADLAEGGVKGVVKAALESTAALGVDAALAAEHAAAAIKGFIMGGESHEGPPTSAKASPVVQKSTGQAPGK